MATIQVDIVSAEGEIHSGTASMVFAPAKMGEVGIAPRHAPMLTPLIAGRSACAGREWQGRELLHHGWSARSAAAYRNGSGRHRIAR